MSAFWNCGRGPYSLYFIHSEIEDCILKEFQRISTGIKHCNSADLKEEGDKKDVLVGGRLIPLGLSD